MHFNQFWASMGDQLCYVKVNGCLSGGKQKNRWIKQLMILRKGGVGRHCYNTWAQASIAQDRKTSKCITTQHNTLHCITFLLVVRSTHRAILLEHQDVTNSLEVRKKQSTYKRDQLLLLTWQDHKSKTKTKLIAKLDFLSSPSLP